MLKLLSAEIVLFYEWDHESRTQHSLVRSSFYAFFKIKTSLYSHSSEAKKLAVLFSY